jgi:transcriptional regulator with XRE-family HTH domain
MSTALLDPDTRESLRSQAGRVEGLVGLGVEESPSGDEELTHRLARRWEWYLGLEDSVRDLVQALPAGVEDYEARQLLVFLTTLRRAVESDAAASAADSTVQLAAMQVGDIARRLERRLEHAALEDADEAASYVFAQLGSIGATELARLLGVSTKTVSVWRSGKPVKQKADRVKLVAQLVSYLRYSMTPTGLAIWFDNAADALGGRSPLGLLDESVSGAWEPLVSYARGGRGQLAG